MTKLETAKLKDLSMEMDLRERFLTLKALDTIANYERCIEEQEKQIVKLSEQLRDAREIFNEASKGTLEMLEQANQKIDRLQMRADAAWETNRTLMKSVDLISGERDANHKRLVFLETQYAKVLLDFQRSLLGDPCDYCGNRLLSEEDCIESNLCCDVCGHTDCACHDCRDCDKWEWRGAGV